MNWASDIERNVIAKRKILNGKCVCIFQSVFNPIWNLKFRRIRSAANFIHQIPVTVFCEFVNYTFWISSVRSLVFLKS